MTNEEVIEHEYARFRDSVDKLRAFPYATNDHQETPAAQHRARLLIDADRVANAIVVLGELARRQPRLLPVSLTIVRLMNHQAAAGAWRAALFSAAEGELRKPYFDVARYHGPEACRYFDCESPYSLSEKLIVLETLRSLCDDWRGPHWTAQRLAVELSIQLPQLS